MVSDVMNIIHPLVRLHPRRMRIPALLACLLPAAVPVTLGAQVVPIDEATFRIFQGEEVVGEERITIHRLGLGQDARIIGQSEIRLRDGSEMRPRLEATPDLRATTYQNKFTGAEDGEIVVTRVGRRLVARSRSAAGEAQQEYRASDRTVILEPRVVLLYYFLQPWVDAEDRRLTVLDPRTGSQETLTLSPVDTRSVRVGRRTVEARHLLLENGSVSIQLWLDGEGRVLRVDIPDQGFRAERLPA